MSDLLKELLARRDALQTEMDALVAAPTAEDRAEESRGDFTPEEAARFAEIRDELAPLDERIADLHRQAEAAKAAAETRAKLDLGTGDPTRIRVGDEPRVYRKGGPNRYFGDLATVAARAAGAAVDDYGARLRLARHAEETEVEARAKPGGYEARALDQLAGRLGVEERSGLTTTVGSGGTFLPPAYLLQDWIAYPRQLRVLADLVLKQDLPRGPMTIEIPKITGATGVAAQATQNTSATETDLTDAYITAPVNTVAGQQTVSLQAIEQSSVPFDEIVFSDLNMALDNTMETYVVNGSGSSGQPTGVLNVSSIGSVTYTSGSPTQTAAWPYVGQAKAKVYDAIFRPADAILMYPDRWAWFETATDTAGRPLVVPSSDPRFNVLGQVDSQPVNAPTPVGRMFGLPVYITAAIPNNLGGGTNQDEIIVLSTKDLILWESAPVARALPQTLGNQLSILLQVYEYAAFMGNRLPGAICTVGGTGFTTPSF